MSIGLVSVDETCKIINGGSWNQTEYVPNGIKVIKVSNLINDGIDESNLDFLPKEALKKYSKNILNAYDLVITTVGSHPQLKASAAGRGFLIPKKYEGSLLNQNAVCIRTKNENILHNKYLAYLGRSFIFRHYIQQGGRGAANQMRIAISIVKKFEFELPPLQSQKRIADILSGYDDLIENNLKRIKLLEQAAKNIYKEWFVNLRFPEYENTPINEETGLPQGWGNGVVSDLCEVKSGFAFKSKHWKKEGNPVMKIKNINNNTVDIDNSDFVDNDVAGLAKKYELFPGDVIIAMTGATVGKVGLIPKIGKRIYLNQRVGLFRPLTEENDNIALVFSFFLTDDSQQQVLNFAQGAAQPNISGSEIGNIKLNIADSKVLSLFNKMIEPSFQLVQSLYGQNQKLKAARDILLPRLMNRTIEV
jgi:type I restriction enzyme S subunit